VQLENDDMEVDMMEMDPPVVGMQLVVFNHAPNVPNFQAPLGQEADLVAPNMPGSPISEGENDAGLQLAILNHAPVAENLQAPFIQDTETTELNVLSGSEGEGDVGPVAQIAHELIVQETSAAVSQSAVPPLDKLATDGQSVSVPPLQPFDVVQPSFSFSNALPATITDESLTLSHKRGHSMAFEEGRPNAAVVSPG
jgi:hypothetical protein